MLGAILLVVGLALDAKEITEITLREQAIGWQWVAMAGGVLFMLFAVWTQVSLYRAFADHTKYRGIAIGLSKFIGSGNALLDIYCRPESPTPVGKEVNDWLFDSVKYLVENYPEGIGYFVNDNIDFFDESTPVSCRQIRGRLERLNALDRELRSLAGGMAVSPER